MIPIKVKILTLPETERWCLKRLKSINSTIRLDAIFTLYEIGTTSTEEIIPLLDDEDYRVRALAAKLLGNWGNKSIEPKLLDKLNDKHWLVQGNVIFALGKIGVTGGIEQVRQILRSKNHGFVEFACSTAFK